MDIKNLVPEVHHNRALDLSLAGIVLVYKMIFDLEFKLIYNKTSTSFICSDFPVVKYNQFLENSTWNGPKTGYAMVGLQIFLPLNPKIMLMLHDSNIYNVGISKSKYIELKSVSDVNQFNLMQFANCRNTVYFNDTISNDYIKKLYTKSKKYNKANEHFSQLTYLAKSEKDKEAIKKGMMKKNFIVLGTTDCEINLNIKLIKIKPKAKKITVSNKTVMEREWAKKVRKEMKEEF